MVPQSGVSRQRPNRPEEYWHPFAQGQALHLHAVSQDLCRNVRDSLLSPAHCGRPCCADRHVARPWLSGASYCGGLWVRRADGRGMEGTRWPPRPGRPGASGRATAGPRARCRPTRYASRAKGPCLDGARYDGFYPVVAGWRGQRARHAVDPAPDRAGARLCPPAPAVVVYRWLVLLYSRDARDLS